MMDKTEEELIWESYDKSLITERDQGIEHGCLMVYLDEESSNKVKQFCQDTFNPEILAEFGIEEEPHITCQYGFTDEVSVEDINEFVNNIIQRPISIELGEISRFDNDDYDVIKVDVNSPDLHELSDKIREYFGDRLNVTYPNYHPHMTLAYIQKGSLPHIDGDNMFKGKNHTFEQFVYSDASNEKYDIKKG